MAVQSRIRALPTYAVAAVVVLAVLVAGLDRFGIWQPAELRVADIARDGDNVQMPPGVERNPPPGQVVSRPTRQRPPAQIGMVRFGFQRLGATEVGGRLPTALLAVLATLALAFAVGSAVDPRAGAFTGMAYATMPLVFLNARQMFGGGVAQSAFTLFFAAVVYVLWGRPPRQVEADDGKDPSPLAMLWSYGRWFLLATVFLAAAGGGWMLGVAPVLLGVGIAVLLRFRNESLAARVSGAVLALGGAVLAIVSVRAAISAVLPPALPYPSGVFNNLTDYSPLLGVGTEAHAAATLPTYEAIIEQIGHGTFPWTGIVAFGLVRLLFPAAIPVGPDGRVPDSFGEAAAWRESGLRLAAFLVAVVAFGLQSFHLQEFGVSPFIAAAPLGVAVGIALRDAEREGTGWRLITAATTFFTIIVMRDYLLFPKSAYSALGLADGGPGFPTGFTSTLKAWFQTHRSHALGDILAGRAVGEVYFVIEALLFILISLSALFQGAGEVKPFPWARPYTWMQDVERDARAHLQAAPSDLPPRLRFLRLFSGFGMLSYLRIWLAAVSLVLVATCGIVLLLRGNLPPRIDAAGQMVPQGLSTPAKNALTIFTALPFIVAAMTYGILTLWNLFAWLGARRNPLMRVFGTRIGLVMFGGVVVALVNTQLFVVALSEHLSPRGVWAVIRRERTGNEPVARYGGNQNGDRATRYYANFDVRDVTTEGDAVEWLTSRDPRHWMIVGADVFPALNRSYRRALPQDRRTNVPVIDATNSNLYVAASDLRRRGGGLYPDRNPLSEFVLTTDVNNSGRLWHPHGRFAGNEFVEEPARFDDAIEYLGFNLDSGGQSFVAVGGTFRITYHFRVLREMQGSHQIFVHVDGPCPRINGDHPPVGDRYPVRYWLAGDYIHDEQSITIPSYCRGGRYFVNIGFFQGDDRMRVTGGDHDRENRVVAARINVR